jgi:hypothetical protein
MQPAEGLRDEAVMRKTCSMRTAFLTTEAKKKLMRPCREARVSGL